MHFLSLLPLSINFLATCLFATRHLPAPRHVLFGPSHASPPTKVSSHDTKNKASKPNQEPIAQPIKQNIKTNQSTRPSDKQENIPSGKIKAALQVEVNVVGDKT